MKQPREARGVVSALVNRGGSTTDNGIDLASERQRNTTFCGRGLESPPTHAPDDKEADAPAQNSERAVLSRRNVA